MCVCVSSLDDPAGPGDWWDSEPGGRWRENEGTARLLWKVALFQGNRMGWMILICFFPTRKHLPKCRDAFLKTTGVLEL